MHRSIASRIKGFSFSNGENHADESNVRNDARQARIAETARDSIKKFFASFFQKRSACLFFGR
jgi:hypothetical protein